MILKVMRRASSFVFDYRPVYLYAISSPPECQVEARCPLEIRKGAPEDIDFIGSGRELVDTDPYLRRLRRRFAMGAEPFLGISEGKLAHSSWLFRPPRVVETNVDLRLSPDQVHIGACWTSTKFRGMNIYPTVLRHIQKYAFARGAKSVFIAAAPENIASTRGIEKAGFVRVKKVSGFVLFGRMWNYRWQASVENIDSGPMPLDGS